VTHTFLLKVDDATGDTLKYRTFGDSKFNLYVDDMQVDGDFIYLVGQYDSLNANLKSGFIMKLNSSLESVQPISFSKIAKGVTAENKIYTHVFVKDNLLYSICNNFKTSTILSSTFDFNLTSTTLPIVDLTPASDVIMVDGNYCMLVNDGQSATTLYNISTDCIKLWNSEPITEFQGKSVAHNSDGTFMVCGINADQFGNSSIKFCKLNSDGSLQYGQDYFRTIPGDVKRIIQTKDEGLILIGSTNQIFGTTIQLIKTDKDYFMLKP
jgi:hypothetical protein